MRHLLILISFGIFSNAGPLVPAEELLAFDPNLQQQWGYTEVYHDVYLFWWFYMQNPPTKPLLIWLGFHSTAETNFNQYGPISRDFKRRNNSLIHDYNILFIDSMAGAGFSYANNDKYFTRSIHETAYDILISLKLFFIKFPAFQISPAYIVADSFFGRMAPEVARLWNTIGSRENVRCNLMGFIINVDPYFILQANILKNYEIIKKNRFHEFDKIHQIINKIEHEERANAWLTASVEIDNLLRYFPFDPFKSESLVNLSTAFAKRILIPSKQNNLNKLMNYQVKKELNLTSTWKFCETSKLFDNVIKQLLEPAFVRSCENLLKTTNLSMTFLNTPMDLKVDTRFNAFTWVENLDWHGKDMWNIQYEIPFTFNNKVVGFKKNYENVHQYVITRNSNSNSTTNADFLRTIFAEIMK